MFGPAEKVRECSVLEATPLFFGLYSDYTPVRGSERENCREISVSLGPPRPGVCRGCSWSIRVCGWAEG